MKPPEKYTEWLQAHPAVWEALQEGWEPKAGDWVTLTHKGERELNCLGTMDDSMDWAAWVKDSLDSRIILWLPDLSQLVRMLRQVTEEREFDTALWETGFKLCHYLTKGAWAGELWHGTRTLEETDFCDEPEIACTALWAKVKGVE